MEKQLIQDATIDTLGKWIIQKVSTSGWRTGKVTGIKHYKRANNQDLLEIFGRENLFRQMKELEKEDFIKITMSSVNTDWREFHFPIAGMDRLLERERIIDPRSELKEKRDHILKWKEKAQEEWLVWYYEEQLQMADKGNIPVDARDEEFYHCLDEVVHMKSQKWMRKFSEDLFGDSKKFERIYKNRIVSILRRKPHTEDDMTGDMTDYEVLNEFGVMTYSQTLHWKGTVMLRSDWGSLPIDYSSMCYGAIVNAQTLLHSHMYSIGNVRKVLIVENQANYESLKFDEEVLAIYCHGFFSPLERKILREIYELADDSVEFYHWSDMDLGGMRIYRFVKKNLFPRVKPYLMGRDAYERALEDGKGHVLEHEKRKKIENFDPEGIEELQELKDCILEYGVEFEQEVFL